MACRLVCERNKRPSSRVESLAKREKRGRTVSAGAMRERKRNQRQRCLTNEAKVVYLTPFFFFLSIIIINNNIAQTIGALGARVGIIRINTITVIIEAAAIRTFFPQYPMCPRRMKGRTMTRPSIIEMPLLPR